MLLLTMGWNVTPAAAERVHVVPDENSPTGGIQEAVEQLGPEGGTVFIPAGRYQMRAPVYLDYVNKPITLAGEGPATVLVAANEYQLTITESAGNEQRTVEIDHPERVEVGDYLWIPSTKGKWHATRTHVAAVEMEAKQLRLEQPIRGPVAANTVAYHSYPLIYAKQVEHLIVRDMKLVGSLRQESYTGWSSWLGNPALLIYGKEGEVRNVEVVDAPSDAISMQAGGPYRVRDCRVRNAGSMGIHLGSNATRVHIRDNLLEGIGQWGIYLCNGSQHFTVANNVVLDVGAYETAEGEVVYERHLRNKPRDNPGYLRYRWNSAVAAIGGLGGGGKTDRYNTITGNVIRHSRGAGISFLRWKPEAGERPGAFYAISGNMIEDVAYAAVHVYAAEAVSVTGNTIADAGEGVALVKA
ncbi:MAG: right-handed parallel beta-helix repeat-containing protein, partial [bacterium]